MARPGDSKVHLVPNGDPYALCGRPAGKPGWRPYTGDDAQHHSVAAKDRCRDCRIAAEHLPRRPAVPIFPWRL